ncbi:FAD-dependent monooxygenase [Phytohabitans flavus]|uniref:Oxidoreductase n=1 Tax=Phytohabitans flavus TaxID=1076124 RepID=A0A6F8XUM7_9ACTN|nr:oxidoreductase [Phytohabitans flavus]
MLISGAGIAGPTLAYWLARAGLRPTVVERAGAPRSSGSPVDVRGPALAVAERMGVVPDLRAAATAVTGLTFVDSRGRRVGRIPMGSARRGEVELPRGDLATILYEAGRDTVEYVFGDHVTALDQDAGGVDVTFAHAAPRRFDLVVGADGLHSAVRRLAFGPEAAFVRHLGLHIATAPLPGEPEGGRDVTMWTAPGRTVAIHPSRGRALAAFMFRGPAVPGLDHRDIARHRTLVTDAYADAGWRVPELLDVVRTTPDLYLDGVCQVRLPRWSNGRVTLLGDAASCVSLFGDGSTLAMAGAATLADALAAHPHDHGAALAAYESRHRTLVDPRQRGVARGAALLIPATRAGLTARDASIRVLSAASAVRSHWARAA